MVNEEYSRGNTLINVLVLGVLGLALLASLFVLLRMSATLHPEAVDVRTAIDSNVKGICQSGLYVAPARGTLLILTKMPTGQTGGQVIRFFEHYYDELVPTDKIYECTAFAACDQYWCRVIKRDGYILLMDGKWVLPGGFFIALGALVAWLRHRNRGGLADEIEDA